MGIEYNPLRAEHRLDPYPLYHALRTGDPVHFSELFQGWVLTRHADVVAVLRDARFSVDRTKMVAPALSLPQPREELREIADTFKRTLLFADPPDHTRIRNLVSKAFTPRMVEEHQARVREIVDELLDAVEARGHMDLIAELASPLPLTVIAEILGVPPEDRSDFKRWSDDLAVLLDPFVPAAVFERAQSSALELYHYLREVFADRRRRPRQDVVSALVAAEEQGDVLSEAELFATCALLLGGGHETTTNLIGNGVLALLRNPQERRRLQNDPALIRTAVDEFLRYESPVQLTGRMATEDYELGGKTIAKGELVLLVLGAANRDPEQFPEPDRLDLDRRDNRHVAFSSGIHSCLGSALARLEGQIAVAMLLRRFPDFEAEFDAPDWYPTIVSRGLKTLPLSF